MNAKKPNPALVIMRRELAAYFASPVAYIVTGLFLVVSGVFFFMTFFMANRAELRDFFSLLPITLSFFIPALTMRSVAEEKRSGSIETLLTLPVTAFDVALGKFLAACACGAAMLVPTLAYVATCALFGSPDPGPIVGGYFGALFLVAAFSAIGLFATSLTKNQIVAFFIACPVCLAFSLLGGFLVFLPARLVSVCSYFSAYSHFVSISRGVIDTRDLLYFVSLTALFFALTVETLKGDSRK